MTETASSRRNPWAAVRSDVDLLAWARLLRRAHDLALSRGTSAAIVREIVASSWMRCISAGVDPERPAPRMLDQPHVAARLQAHPLRAQLPLITNMLGDAIDAGEFLMALSDADGVLLWADGHRAALQRAEKPHFLPGFLCSEAAVGTNAIGTAVVLDQPVQIFSAEHFSRLLHAWTCAAAPIHDPETRRLLGVLNVSGSYRSAHPHSLPLVCAVARAVEAELAQDARRRDERLKSAYVERVALTSRRRSALVTADGRVVMSLPAGWMRERVEVPAEGGVVSVSPDIEVIADPIDDGRAHILWQIANRRAGIPRPKLGLQTLGRAQCSASMLGQRTDLGLRHSEILVLLALHPEGLSGKELAVHLYGTPDKRVTVRAEMSRLRKLLGPLLAANPYRLVAEVCADFLDVQQLLDEGRRDAAAERYAGPLLPPSEVPAIAAARRALDDAVRAAAREPSVTAGAAGDADRPDDVRSSTLARGRAALVQPRVAICRM